MKVARGKEFKRLSRLGVFIIAVIFSFSISAFGSAKNLNSKGITNKLTAGYISNNLRDSGDFKWTSIQNWDKIYISDSHYPKYKITIKDKRILKSLGNFWGIFNYIESIPEEPNGNHSDVEYYKYEFIKGNKTYKVDVVGTNRIEVDGVLYELDADIYYLGKAFLPFPKYIKTDSVLNKIYESGCLIGNYQFTYPLFDSFRIRGFSNYIQDGIDSGEVKLLKSKPKNVKKTLEILDFYYYGQKIVMDVYDSYISLKDGKKIIWYKIKSGENLLTILSAG